jgi:hypothetical protein
MKAHKAGSIINVASIWGTAAVPGAHAYHATKGALSMMSKNAAITYVGDGIRVNSVHPGFIDTPLTQAQDPAINAHVIGLTPMKRAGTPLEIANGCLFLASDESSFMTGAELVIDGGYLAQSCRRSALAAPGRAARRRHCSKRGGASASLSLRTCWSGQSYLLPTGDLGDFRMVPISFGVQYRFD